MPLRSHLVDATPEVDRFQAILRTYFDFIQSGLLGSSSVDGNILAETSILRNQAQADLLFVSARVRQCPNTGKWFRLAGVGSEVIDSLLRKHEDRQEKWASDYLDSLCS